MLASLSTASLRSIGFSARFESSQTDLAYEPQYYAERQKPPDVVLVYLSSLLIGQVADGELRHGVWDRWSRGEICAVKRGSQDQGSAQ